MAAGAHRPPGSFQLENRLDGRVATLATNDKFNNTAIVAARGLGRVSQQWRLFQLQLKLATGPPYFAAPEPLTALSSPAGNELQPVPAPMAKRYTSRVPALPATWRAWPRAVISG
ncbi:hypothetical protein [Hymenobacter sp. BRD67]|uniref:hypothetical protein n=1 Tax=Hymenobacter sp. BRD67 TaxID=2675877 RepID=UPI001566DA6D|nr:hypothetical protein [Hymenobacter sp. BRD67]QKG51364.1 hypothetical protein GKZ67_00670 [Hymenobacter sp. BRD67]